MRPGGGKAKGSSFEREIARVLSRWWTGLERDDVFARTMSSGAWGTQRAMRGRSTFGQYGDLQAIDPIGQPFLDVCCIEIKIGYGSWCILDALDRLRGTHPQTFENFLIQAQCSAERAGGGRFPVLIAKRDRKEAVIAYPLPLQHRIEAVSGAPGKDVGGMRIHIPNGEYPWILMRLDEFVEWASPEVFKKPVQKIESKPKLKLKLKSS